MTVEDSPIKLPVAAPPSPDQSVPQFRTFLKNRPIVRAELPHGSTAWGVSGYEEVRQALVDQRFSRGLAVAPARPLQRTEGFAAGPITRLDPPSPPRSRNRPSRAVTARR